MRGRWSAVRPSRRGRRRGALETERGDPHASFAATRKGWRGVKWTALSAGDRRGGRLAFASACSLRLIFTRQDYKMVT
jgi:hypothetical protein